MRCAIETKYRAPHSYSPFSTGMSTVKAPRCTNNRSSRLLESDDCGLLASAAGECSHACTDRGSDGLPATPDNRRGSSRAFASRSSTSWYVHAERHDILNGISPTRSLPTTSRSRMPRAARSFSARLTASASLHRVLRAEAADLSDRRPRWSFGTCRGKAEPAKRELVIDCSNDSAPVTGAGRSSAEVIAELLPAGQTKSIRLELHREVDSIRAHGTAIRVVGDAYHRRGILVVAFVEQVATP